MLEAKNIIVSFGEQCVLEDASIKLQEGERIALLGPSGAGKSTLLRVLSGIQVPNKGKISLDGICPNYEIKNSLTTVTSWVWPRVTLVFQDLKLFPNLTGTQNCSENLHSPTKEEFLKIKNLSSKLNVLRCMDKTPNKMSQGEQQRIAIVRAIMKNPTFLLMDEPTAALDVFIRNELSDLLIEQSKNNMGILIATHDWEFANRFANKFIVIKNHKLYIFDSIISASREMSRSTI